MPRPKSTEINFSRLSAELKAIDTENKARDDQRVSIMMEEFKEFLREKISADTNTVQKRWYVPRARQILDFSPGIGKCKAEAVLSKLGSLRLEKDMLALSSSPQWKNRLYASVEVEDVGDYIPSVHDGLAY